MKNFFATAALAATSYASMSGEEIGELVAGIFYGIGIDSGLDDFSHCMSDGYVIEQDVTDAIAQFEHSGTFHITKGVRDLIDIVHHFPEAFHGCTHMFDDIAAIAEWTSIVAHPQELKQKVERNTALHIIKIKKDITELKEEFAGNQFFKAGETIGELLTLELGKVPLSNQSEENLTVPQIYDIATFVSGIIYGLSDQGNLVDLSECLIDAEAIQGDFQKALGDLFQGKIHDAVVDLAYVTDHLTTASVQCHQIQSDLHAIEKWLSVVKDISALKKQIEKNTARHLLKVKRDISTAKADIAAQEYFQAGEVVADLLLIELGNMPDPFMSTFNGGLQNSEEVIAGLIYGLIGDNYLPEIETCIGNIQNLTYDVQKAEEYFNLGTYQDTLSGLYYLGLALQELPEDFTNCSSGLQDDLARISEWAQIFTQPKALASDIKHNILTNPIKAERELKRAQKDWAIPDYYNFGTDVADLLVLAVGPLPFTFSSTYTSTLDDTYNIIAGLIYGLVGDNYLPEIEVCAGNISNLTNDVSTAIADFKVGSYQSVLNGLYYLGLALQELPQDFTNCSTGLQDDLARIGDWAHIFIEPVQLAEDVSTNILTNPIKAERDLHRAKKDCNLPDYFACGEDVADILVLAVGPVPVEAITQ